MNHTVYQYELSKEVSRKFAEVTVKLCCVIITSSSDELLTL
jgi:hypothetical protein